MRRLRDFHLYVEELTAVGLCTLLLVLTGSLLGLGAFLAAQDPHEPDLGRPEATQPLQHEIGKQVRRLQREEWSRAETVRSHDPRMRGLDARDIRRLAQRICDRPRKALGIAQRYTETPYRLVNGVSQAYCPRFSENLQQSGRLFDPHAVRDITRTFWRVPTKILG